MRTADGRWRRRAVAVADLPARLALGSTMLYHGLSKLRGEGPAQTARMFEGLGLRPGRALAVATGVAETFAGAAAILGIATAPAALAVIVTQAVAIGKVHAPKGFSVGQGGMEFNLALVAMALALLAEGPRTVSAHHAARRLARRRGLPGLLAAARPGRVERALAMLG
ncbi:DoxX family protein [Anaeromyxobacter dehalogenans]|uniref:DoxX n=1 Tax=Anaeromyxobacter dehalogenans (strain 2CP-C) TaxID=290397 RepID=Q2IH60_ANADE|nr:DoxX family protein [Anaeromyxobacter dehalogenans]ABC83915.1 DoxX [Anaeromyxobacter dehalogenans 2CP-C]